jgi:uncharacterized protein
MDIPPPSQPTIDRRPGPVPASQRIATLDVLRGFALLGILLVNVELFGGSALWDVLTGQERASGGLDAVVRFAVGWLAAGKFISSFALLFGVGAAIIGGRALRAGRSPRRLLARRYLWLGLFGIAHMLLLFSGDILFAYGLAGLLLLPLLFAQPRTLVRWAVGILLLYLAVTTISSIAGAFAPDATAGDPVAESFDRFLAERRERVVGGFTDGGPLEQIRARAWEAAFVQGGTLFLLPWILALFLLGFAVGKRGLADLLSERVGLLRRAAVIGLGVGLPLNLPLGWGGALGAGIATPEDVSGFLLVAMGVAQTVGAPLLAVGYLSALALACRSDAVLARLAPLEAAGRMALTGYVLESILATAFFVWLGVYDRLGTAQAMLVVVVIWVVVLTFCTLWQQRWGRGPLERLWRRLTYGRPA